MAHHAPLKNSFIFLVEDDALIVALYTDVLKAQGFSVEVAFDGKQALEKLEVMRVKAKIPAVILLDIMMPKMNGFEVLDSIKKNNALKDIPVIILSNASVSGEKDRAFQLGALMYLVKVEHTPMQVIQKVREVIESNGAYHQS